MSLINKFSKRILTVRGNLFQNVKTVQQVYFSQQIQSTGEEIRIPVPWGFIAGKWWGPQDQRPILCLHGWQESCGSFDPLLTILTENSNNSYLGIDFPGHGRSSKLPNGVTYSYTDGPIWIRKLQKYFDWDKISFLSHSMGGMSSFLYSCLYPDSVDMLILIDVLKPFSRQPGTGIISSAENIDDFLKYDAINSIHTEPPSYTYDEVYNKFYLGSRKSIESKNMRFVLERLIEKSKNDPNKFYFTRDSRLKTGVIFGMQHADILEHAKRITCPMIVMKASKSSFFEDKKYPLEVVELIKQNNKNFEYLTVEGTHHMHINSPEIIAPIITKFLDKYNTMNRSKGGIKSEMKIAQ